ncbi:hypothetical protein L1887_10070 [Cichorium endivia]|nr:hypothetical protein L1887_10070 [Cichorium endivia]
MENTGKDKNQENKVRFLGFRIRGKRKTMCNQLAYSITGFRVFKRENGGKEVGRRWPLMHVSITIALMAIPLTGGATISSRLEAIPMWVGVGPIPPCSFLHRSRQ